MSPWATVRSTGQGTPRVDKSASEGRSIWGASAALAMTGAPVASRSSAAPEGLPVLISGDTLFAGTIGRTDFEGGSMSDMRASLKKLAALPDELDGHGVPSNGRSRAENAHHIKSNL